MALLRIFATSLCAFGILVTSSPIWTSPYGSSIANTTSGPVQPFLDDAYPDVYQYLSIPFAQPPVDQLRFAPPQTVIHSSQVLHATELPPGCCQGNAVHNIFDIYEPGFGFRGEQSEDCLKLNVYRPRSFTDEPLPVLIFVYGGGFVIGASNETYEIPTGWVQAKQNLIIVSIQYVRRSLNPQWPWTELDPASKYLRISQQRCAPAAESRS
jgi:carboxylesterase type B